MPDHDRVMTRLIREQGSWEAGESAVLTTLIRSGSHVIDIGAHVGYLTLLAAARTGANGSVLAIEADPTNFELLRANLELNAVSWVTPVHAAAWRRSGETLTMTISPDNSGDNRVFLRDGAEQTVDVPSVAVDELIPGDWHVDVVKVDTQGTDHVAIEGMRTTIGRCHPTVLVEFWPLGIEEFGDDPVQVLGLYRGLGYEIAMLEEPTLSPEAPVRRIVEAARRCQSEYCTLLLRHEAGPAKRLTGDAVESLLDRGPVPGPHSALGRLGPIARRLALRVMRPYTAHQRVLDRELLSDLRELSRRVDALEADRDRPLHF
jgi:FkbM family methyltransferase